MGRSFATRRENFPGWSTQLSRDIRFSALVPAHAPRAGAVVGELDIGCDLEAEALIESHVRLAGGLQESWIPGALGLLDAGNQHRTAEALPLGLGGGSHGSQEPSRLLGPVRGNRRVRGRGR